LNLDPDRRDVRRYVRDLEEVLIGTLADVGVSASRSPLPERVSSVWVGNDKIAAIGVHLSRWITTHGFALNVTDEPLPYFRGIVPCGITDGGVTSIERVVGRVVGVRDLVPKLCARFAAVFGREIEVAGP
jgi:lipoyl(octanoyl) transferase